MRCNDGAAGQSLLPGPGPDDGPVESSPSPCPSFDIYDLEDSQQLLHDSTPLSIEDPAFEVALATIHPDLIANSSVDGGDASSREELFSKAEEKKPKYEGEPPLAGGGGGCSSGRKRAIEEPAGEEEEELTHQLKQQRLLRQVLLEEQMILNLRLANTRKREELAALQRQQEQDGVSEGVA